MKKLFLGFIIGLFGISGFLFAQGEIDGFRIDIEPDSFQVNEAVDLTITAIKDGEVVSDYLGDIIMDVYELNASQYTLPSDSIYSFKPDDLGSVKFSKGLVIYEDGTFTFTVEDLTTQLDGNSLKVDKTIIVGTEKKEDFKEIDIISPIKNSIENSESINIIGSSLDLPNTGLDIYINSQLIGNTRTNGQGDFNTTVFKEGILLEGDNSLEVKSFDANKNLIGESGIVVFQYVPLDDELLKNLEILPSNTVNLGDKVTVNATTNTETLSSILVLSNGKQYPMDKENDGVFSKTFTTDFTGTVSVGLSLNQNGLNSVLSDMDTLTVNEVHNTAEVDTGAVVEVNTGDVSTGNVQILKVENIKVVSDSIDGSTVNISWDSVGELDKYILYYGTGKDSLLYTIEVDTNDLLIENLNPDVPYYFQVGLLNELGEEFGEKSKIVRYGFSDGKACVIKEIKIKTVQEGDKYYLMWDPIEGAIKYEIYKTDFVTKSTTIDDMQKVTVLEDTKFEYPFDPNAETEKYAYYAVVAICENGTTLQIDDIQEVQVGPVDNLILILVLALLFFGIYKIYKNVD